MKQNDSGLKGLIYAAIAFGTWGFLPLYWNLFIGIEATDVLFFRIIWSCLVMSICLLLSSQIRQTCQILLSWQKFYKLFLSGLLCGLNWYLFIYAATSGQVLESALGYFICPIVNVCLGIVFLKERLRKLQKFSVLLMFLAGLYAVFFFGKFPWIASSIAVCFALYGLC